jgi:predicted  nucleic acid-binding Zn-ribbon protein
MAGPAMILREIHRLKRFAKDLQDEIDRGPRLLRGQQTRVARQEELYKGAQDELKRLKVASHEKEVLLKATLQQIDKHERQLNEAGSKKEYDALKAEIASDKRKCSQLEDDILETLTQIDEHTAQLPLSEQAVRQAKAEYAEFEKTSEGRLASLRQQLTETERQITDVEATLPDDIRPNYARLIAARGEDSLAPVENRTCMACYTEITAQNANDLAQGKFVFCKSCGRALYLPG